MHDLIYFQQQPHTHDPHSLASSKLAAIGERAINTTDTPSVSYTSTQACGLKSVQPNDLPW